MYVFIRRQEINAKGLPQSLSTSCVLRPGLSVNFRSLPVRLDLALPVDSRDPLVSVAAWRG